MFDVFHDCAIEFQWKMSHHEILDVNLSTESDDLTEENWFSSPTTSFDGSSVNSIPWAEDVVKQNKEIWDRIERWFYGEETLPDDEKLRSEIIEWNSHFPHIRIVGEQAPIYYDASVTPVDSNYEEVIDVHSSTSSQLGCKSPPVHRNLEQVLEDSLHIDIDHRDKSGVHCNRSPVRRYHDDNGSNIEKCLRITSGVLLSKRYQSTASMLGTNDENRSSARTSMSTTVSSHRRTANPLMLKPIPSEFRCIRIRKDNFDEMINNRIILEPIHLTKSEPISLSARLIKMPGIPIESAWHAGEHTQRVFNQNKIRIATASVIPSKRPLRTSLTLPAINLVPVELFTGCSHERSISAVMNVGNARSAVRHVPCKSARKLHWKFTACVWELCCACSVCHLKADLMAADFVSLFLFVVLEWIESNRCIFSWCYLWYSNKNDVYFLIK